MRRSLDRFSQVAALALMVTGMSFYLGYLIFLPMQERFVDLAITDLGFMLYSLGTAGAGFVVWSWMLLSVDAEDCREPLQYRKRVLQASAMGFFMLGLMRVGTALFPHAPFLSMVSVPVAESVLFVLIGFVFLRKAGMVGSGLQAA